MKKTLPQAVACRVEDADTLKETLDTLASLRLKKSEPFDKGRKEWNGIMKLLANKVAAVTGGATGIGRSICLAMAEQGADIAILYVAVIPQEVVDETVRAIEEKGVRAKAYVCDVSNFTETENVMKEVMKDMGSIDILVNNAGITRDNLMVRMSEADFDAVISVNLKGMFNTIHALYRPMMKKGGRIINIASVSGMMGNVGQANYSAAKAGVIGLTKTVAKELATRNVTVNAIAPGFIATQMTEVLSDAAKETALSGIPMKKMGRPEDIANAAVFLASDMASYITGEVLRVDGGMCM